MLSSKALRSFEDRMSNICYGFAMMHSLRVIYGSTTVPPEHSAMYSLRFINYVQAFMLILIFAAVALFGQEVVNCFFIVGWNQSHML